MSSQTDHIIEYTCDFCAKKVSIFSGFSERMIPDKWRFYAINAIYCPSCKNPPFIKRSPINLTETSMQLIEFPLSPDDMLADYLEERGYLEQSKKLRS